MNMNAGQARVIDPILTNHVRGYRNAAYVGSLLFPSVEVAVSAGKVIEFGKEDFMLYNARRAPGGATKRIEFGYLGKPFALVQDSLESKVPREFARDAAAVPGIDLGMRAGTKCMNSLTLALEYEQAVIATDANNYAASNKIVLTGTDQWTHADSKPTEIVEEGRQVIRNSCGIYPNVLVLGPVAYSAMKNNEYITNRFRNVDIITADMLAKLFELDQVVEGKAVTANQDGLFSDIWGNYAVLAYAPKTPSGLEEPSYGYTYTMRGHPFVESPYWEGNQKSWIYGVTYERAPVLAGKAAGYLIGSPAATE